MIASSGRCLVAQLCADGLKAVVIVGHAPHSGLGEEASEQWWGEIAQSATSLKDWPVIALLDANAHLGSVESEAVGGEGAELEDASGRFFHQWLHDVDCCLPSTFSGHVGEHGTWRHPKGRWYRNDFVAVPLNWREHTRSFALEDFHIELAKEDHRAVGVEVTLQTNVAKSKRGVTRVSSGDRRRLSNLLAGECSGVVTRAVQAGVGGVWWATDVHTHAHQLNAGLAQASQWLAPSSNTKPRKAHVGETTWQMVLCKKRARKELTWLSRSWRAGCLRELFIAWQGVLRQGQHASCSVAGWLRAHDAATALALRELQHWRDTASKAMRADDADFFKHLAEEAGRAAERGGLSGVWQKIRPFLSKNKTKRQAKASQLYGMTDKLVDHFNQLEAGCPMEFASLAEACVERQSRAMEARSSPWPLTELITLKEVEDVCRTSKPGKGVGLDGVLPELLHGGADVLSWEVFSLFNKIQVAGQEPFQFKGGVIAPIYKGKGAMTDPGNHRGVVLLEAVGKRFHALLRRKLLPAVEKQKTELQMGGFHGQQVTFGAQYVRALEGIAQPKGLSTAVLFVDVKSAYHHLVREVVFGHGGSEGDLHQVLEAMQADGADVDSLQETLARHPILESLGVADWLRNLLRDVHADTWIVLDKGGSPSRTTRGSRPGSPLADIGFSVLMLSVLSEIEAAMKMHGDTCEVLRALGLPCCPVTWADDIAIHVITTQREALVPAIAGIARCVDSTMRKHGLTPNYSPGKTETLVCFRGFHPPRLRKQLFLTGEMRIAVELENGTHIQLHVASRYKHLGSVVGMYSDVGHEIKRRIAVAAAAEREIRKPILNNKRLSVEVLGLHQAVLWHEPVDCCSSA